MTILLLVLFLALSGCGDPPTGPVEIPDINGDGYLSALDAHTILVAIDRYDVDRDNDVDRRDADLVLRAVVARRAKEAN